MDIFNHKEKKLLLTDFLKGLEDGVIVLTDRELDNIEGTTGLEVQNLVQSVTGEHETPIQKHRRLEQIKGVINYFIVVLKPSNVNQSGHGVYVARHLFRIYRSWKNYIMVNLIRRGECWKVGVCIKRRICRFGRGWDDFTKNNELKEGDRVKFTHVSDNTFQVRVGVYV
ncbi:hypothetical protein POM88_023045 [Heracleum sosnowskyi]|uniref:TF-B3 domain-containing protein n=1 Tax=Heracleum sosnowskyi TaxID=360622 RepID=A0AAD8IGH9_9APIA|nr:hypothetical protein POM88_023045 [Heracleum sosnowskyi]